jgi:exonuclease SbcD
VKILHTSDWHVGKTIRGESRLDEHTAVLTEIVTIATAEAVDLVLVAGDLYESAAPNPDAEAVVMRALLALRAVAPVVVIAGNHDNAARFEAIRPLAAAAGIEVRGRVARPEEGGVVTIDTAAGERARIALLPFCSPRWSVRAADLMRLDAAAAAGEYAERLAAIVHALCADADPEAVNVLVAHCMVRGGVTGGGERDAQTSFEPYWLSATTFPPSLAYGALGHLHLAQRVPTGAPVWYSGAPIQVDFGEAGAGKHVLLVDVTPSSPAHVREVPLRSGTELRTVTGTAAELEAMDPAAFGDAWLRVRVHGPARAGLADDVRSWLGDRVVEVRVLGERSGPDRAVSTRQGRSPHDLFDAYLAEQGIDDPRLPALFAELLEAETSA